MEKIGLEAVFEDDNFNRGISNYQSSLDTASDKTGKFGSVLSGAAKVGGIAIAGMATAAVGAIAGITAMVMKASDAAGQLVDMSLKTGIGVEKLQELKYVGEQTGTSLEAITGSMARLTRAMGDVSTSDVMAGNFERLGVSVTDIDGNLRDSEAVFDDVISALGQIDNEAERDALSMEIFGRSARELNPLIIAGADEIERLSEQAHEVGAVMSEDAVMGLEGFGDSVASIKAGIQGTLGTMASAFLPVMQQIAGFVTTVILPAFQNFAQVAGPWLAEKLAIAMDWVSTTLIPILANDVFPWIAEAIPVAINALSVIWQDVLYPAIQVVYGVIKDYLLPALSATWNWLSENLPPVINALSVIWQNVLKPALEAVWGFISNNLIPVFQTIWGWIATTLPPVIQTLSDLWTNTLKPAIEVVWGFISDNLIPIFTTIADIIGRVLTLEITILKGAWENILLPAITTIWQFIDQKLGPVFLWLKETIIDPLAKSIGEGLSQAIEWVNTQLQTLKDWLDSIELPDWLMPGSPTPFEIGLLGIHDALGKVNRELSASNPAIDRYASSFAGIAGPSLSMGMSGGTYDYSLTPGAALSPVTTNNRQRTINISMGGVTIANGMDEQVFISRVEYAIQRALQ